MVTDKLTELVRSALDAASASGAFSLDDSLEIAFQRPKRREHGDWATNVALSAARGGGNPRTIAQVVVDHLPASELVDRVEIAGPGFINFHLADVWLHDVVRSAATEGSGFGRSDTAEGKSVNVEYVSANPTGPINVVSGRHAAVGDAIAHLFDAVGYRVTKEFYVNDAGRQIDLFARSVEARYLQHHGVEAQVPEEGYQGEYIADLAHDIAAEVGDQFVTAEESERVEAMRRLAVDRTLSQMRESLGNFGTTFDVWFSESDLHERKEVEEGIEKLRQRGVVYEKEGAIWFRSQDLGDDKDRVLVRANGEPTYLASDVAYLFDKSTRGFDHLLYLWGADHHGTVHRLLAAAEALEVGRDRVEVRIVQMVSLLRSGETIKASKRAGQLVPLDDLVAEVGPDAARYTFLTRSLEAPLEFDIDLVTEQAPENPVYYVQYAHARICSILRKADEQGVTPDIAGAPLDRLGHPSEDALARKLSSYEETILDAAEARAPQKICRYIEELAASFSAFYRDCKVVSDDPDLTSARLALCVATKSVIADALSLLGVSAPERM
jgi:arginyl-tRNA synthetase